MLHCKVARDLSVLVFRLLGIESDVADSVREKELNERRLLLERTRSQSLKENDKAQCQLYS
jgi:hypothetical protein